MKITIPILDDRLCEHFVECRQFTLLELDEARMTFRSTTLWDVPKFERGELKLWLRRQGVQMLRAGRREASTQKRFCEAGVRVLVGVPSYRVEAIAARYLMGRLASLKTVCPS